mgnify:CR=1 FL=1
MPLWEKFAIGFGFSGCSGFGVSGGVGVSGLEMSQNAMKLNWTAEEVDAKLHQMMSSIHSACIKYGLQDDDYINYVKGANVAGFIKVADTMLDQGII